MLELILGGARSGKSALAARRALDSGRGVVFVATAQACDAEMRERIARHRSERPSHWRTWEVPVRLGEAIRSAPADFFVIADCLTLWIANVLFPLAHDGAAHIDEAAWENERASLICALQELRGDAVLVSNEVGLGLVSESAVGRRFRDEQGRLNQQLAALCERVTFVAAGLPIELKPTR